MADSLETLAPALQYGLHSAQQQMLKPPTIKWIFSPSHCQQYGQLFSLLPKRLPLSSPPKSHHPSDFWIHKEADVRVCVRNLGRSPTFSARASSRVVKAVSVLVVSACKDLTRSFKLLICFSLSLSCSWRFSI